MKNLFLVLVMSLVSVAAVANEPVVLCTLGNIQYMVDVNDHSVYKMIDGVPQKRKVVNVNDNRPSSGDTVTYDLTDTTISLSCEGDEPNVCSLYTDGGTALCLGQ